MGKVSPNLDYWAIGGAALKTGYDMYTTRKSSKRSGSSFNSGYSIVNRKARNSVKRKRTFKKSLKSSLISMTTTPWSYNLVYRNEMELGRGRVLLPNGIFSDGSASSNIACPLILIDLDRYNNSQASGASNARPGMYTLYYNNTDGRYEFLSEVWVKTQADGEATANNEYGPVQARATQWIKDYGSALSSVDKVYQKRLEMDLVMYGQTDTDTLYRVDYVSLDQDLATVIGDYQGNHEASTDTDFSIYPTIGAQPQPITNTSTYKRWNALWHSMVAPYMQNPTYKPEKDRSVIKFLKSYKFKIPEQSGDFDRVPCVKTKIKIPVGRVINKQWIRGQESPVNVIDPESATVLNDAAQDDLSGTGYHSYGALHPKVSRYLIIRATNNDKRIGTVGGDVITVEKGQDPTFDINLRIKNVSIRN